MKYLINADFTVTMKGKAVTTSKLDTDDFIYDTKDKLLSMGQMEEIATVNKLKCKGKKVADFKESLDEALSKLKLPEKKEMSETEKVVGIVKDGHEAGKSEDEILIEIVQAGIKFGQAIKMMKNAMVELGFSVTAKERYNKTKEILEEAEFEPEEYSEVTEMAKKLSEEIGGTSEAQALSQIRKYCKEFEVDMPKKVKEKKASLAVRVMAWISKNVEEDTEDALEALEEFLEEQDAKEKVIESWKNKFKVVQVEYNKLVEAD